MDILYETPLRSGWALVGGERVDPFDLVDALQGSDGKLLIHDLDSERRRTPQLDVIQDISHEASVWYEGAVRSADAVIDPLVAGAEMIVLNGAYLRGIDEFERIISMTENVAIDISSEHADRIRDFKREITGESNLRKLIHMGYSKIVSYLDELKGLASSSDLNDISVWIRGERGSMTEDDGRPATVFTVSGYILQCEELVNRDE